MAHSVHPRDILLLDADQALAEPGQAVGVQCGGHGGPQTAHIGALWATTWSAVPLKGSISGTLLSCNGNSTPGFRQLQMP